MADPIVSGIANMMIEAMWWGGLAGCAVGVLVGWPVCSWVSEVFWSWRDKRQFVVRVGS